jgi:hypothetical protein
MKQQATKEMLKEMQKEQEHLARAKSEEKMMEITAEAGG